jgi:hypothetical protein
MHCSNQDSDSGFRIALLHWAYLSMTYVERGHYWAETWAESMLQHFMWCVAARIRVVDPSVRSARWKLIIF